MVSVDFVGSKVSRINVHNPIVVLIITYQVIFIWIRISCAKCCLCALLKYSMVPFLGDIKQSMLVYFNQILQESENSKHLLVVGDDKEGPSPNFNSGKFITHFGIQHFTERIV